MSLDMALWVVLPYVALTVFAVGHVWRWRTDQFGWTTRTTQLLENRLLRLGSPLFHLGAFAAIAGHIAGVRGCCRDAACVRCRSGFWRSSFQACSSSRSG
jgi:respiratory nitrate reductase gamma subunit